MAHADGWTLAHAVANADYGSNTDAMAHADRVAAHAHTVAHADPGTANPNSGRILLVLLRTQGLPGPPVWP